MTKEQEYLYQVLESFLNECDVCIESRKPDGKCIIYTRINRALDAVYRAESDIPPAPRIGRPPKEEANGIR